MASDTILVETSQLDQSPADWRGSISSWYKRARHAVKRAEKVSAYSASNAELDLVRLESFFITGSSLQNMQDANAPPRFPAIANFKKRYEQAGYRYLRPRSSEARLLPEIEQELEKIKVELGLSPLVPVVVIRKFDNPDLRLVVFLADKKQHFNSLPEADIPSLFYIVGVDGKMVTRDYGTAQGFTGSNGFFHDTKWLKKYEVPVEASRPSSANIVHAALVEECKKRFGDPNDRPAPV